MPDEIYTPEQKATLEKGIQQMLSQGASDQDVMAYAAAYKQKYGVKKKENTVLPSKVGSSASPKSKVDALADNKTLGTPTGEQFSYAPEAFSENEVKYAPTSKANPPKVPQPIVKPKEEFEYYAPDIYAEEVIAPKSQGINPLTGKPNNPNQYKEAKPSITNGEFNNRLKSVNTDLVSKEEEYAVPQLNYQFKDFGFTFEETGMLGDAMIVKAPNGKTTTINLEPTLGRFEKLEADKLQKFMKENSLQYDKLNKVVSEADNYNRTFNEQKEIDASFAKIQQDQQDFTKSVQELYKLPKDSEEYKTKLAELSQRQVQIENNKKDLNKSVGQYVGMKAQQGETSAYLWNQLLEGTTGAVSGLHGLMVDAFAPETMSDAEKKKAKQWLNPIIRESLDWAKSESTTKEYAQNVGFIEGAVGGLVKSLPAMLAAEGMPLVMAAQISDGLDVEMDNNPDFANISENEKLLLKAPMMIGGAVLETYGFRNAIGTKGLLNDLVANAIGKSTKNTTTKSFKEFIEQDIENRLSKGLIKIGAGGLAEFETGASQELLDIITKEIYNAAKGKEMFQTPDSFGEGAKQVIKAGLQEAIGGFILSTPSAISTAYKKGNYTDLTDGQVDVLKAFGNDVNVMSAIETDLQNKVATGDLTPQEAEEQLNDTRETVGLMNSMETEGLSNDQIKESLPIVDEIKKSEKQKEGKVGIEKKLIQAKIDEQNLKYLKATGQESLLETETETKETPKPESKPLTTNTDDTKKTKTKAKTDEAKVLIEKPQTAVEQSAADGVKLNDINGTEIKIGDTVSTKQPNGGVLPSGDAITGVVEDAVDAFGKKTLQIRYRNPNKDFDQFILLDGKINEIIPTTSKGKVKESKPKPKPKIKTSESKSESQFAEFEKIAKETNTSRDAFIKASRINNVPSSVSKAFREKYDPNGELTPQQAFDKFYKETRKSLKPIEISADFQAKFNELAKKENEISAAETKKINEEFEARQKELEKYIPNTQEERDFNETNKLLDKAINEGLIASEVNRLNEIGYRPQGFSFNKEGSLVEDKTAKQKAKERVAKAEESFKKKAKNLQLGGLETLPEFTELVLAYIELGYVTAKEITEQFKIRLEGFEFDEKIATEKINEILAKEVKPKSEPTEDSEKVKKKVAKKTKKVVEEKPFVSTNKKDTKVIDDLINNIEESGAVEEYLSKGTISSATGETPTNDQKRGVQKLSLALEQGLKIVAYAKELYGDNYVEEFVNYLENSKAPISNIALGFVSLENALYREKMANPERANELTKLQAYVYSRSQLRSRESSKALNYQKLRRFGEVGYDMSEIEKKFFSDIEYEDKGKIEDAVQADMDKINEVALEVEKSFIPKEIEQLIEEAVQKELNDIYETLPPTKKNYAKRALKSLTEVQKKLRSKTYDATVGIPIAIIDFGIESIKKAIQAGVSVSQAIEVGIKAIKSKLDGKEWAKENEFREDALSEFAKFMPKTNETVKQALIKAGFGRTVNIKGQEKEILDWKKLAGAAGTIENIKRNVETVLREEGMNQKEINDMADELTEEYVNLRESVINKAQNDIARRNKEKVTPKQRSAARRLAELYNFGLFEKNVDEFERAIVGALGSKVSEEGLKEAKAIGRAMEAIYATSFRGVPLNDISAKKALEELSNKLRILLYKESKKQGTKFLKFAGIVRNYMELGQSMILNTFKNLFENPYSGFQQNLLDTLNSKFSGTDTKELAKQRRKMMLDIVKDMTLKGAIGYGKIDSQFVNRQHLDDYINKLSDKKLYHFISSIATGKLGLNTMDAMFKASITEKKFAHNLITIMTNESNPNRISKENAIAFVSETLTGQTYKDAQKTAKDVTERINGISNQELMPTNKSAIDRLASDIVKAALQMGNKISADMVEAAYNAAYKNAGLNLGHEPNNMFSRQVQSFAARLESQVDTALKNKQYDKAGKLMLYSTFIRNVINPFAAGGTNWLVLKVEKMGGGLVSGLYNKFGEDLSIDMSTKTGLAKVEQRLYLQSAIKDQFWRGTVGGLVTLMGYIGYAAFLDDDEEFNKWVKENYWSMKYLAFVLSEGGLIDISAENGKLEQYFTKMLGKNEMFESSTKLVKAAGYANKGESDKAIGALGESTSKFFNTPIPWRLVRDGQEIYKGVKGEDPYHPNYKPSQGFISGVLQNGFIEWVGYRPLPEEKIKRKKINRGESSRGGRGNENVRGQ